MTWCGMGGPGGSIATRSTFPCPSATCDPRRHRRTTPAATVAKTGFRDPAAVGLLLAVAAAVVTVTRPPLSVYLEDDAVHVAGLTLSHPMDNGGLADGHLFTGPATLLMVDRPHGAVVASAVTYLGGQGDRSVRFRPADHDEVAESCILQIGSVSVTCEDALRFEGQGSWQRGCSDGQRLTVTVPAGAVVIPMPFPLGR